VILAVANVTLLSVITQHMTLNEHARNVTWAVNDATRVMERWRQQNRGCAFPSLTPPTGFTSWNTWLGTPTSSGGGGGKSVQPDPNTDELVVVTCRDAATNASCGDVSQVGTGEWSGTRQAGQSTAFPLLQTTVTICWRHRNRVLGECNWNGAALSPNDDPPTGNNDDVVTSPATLSTLMTCRA
jgi:hypothetical protein